MSRIHVAERREIGVNGKFVSGLLCVVVLVGVLALSFNVLPAKASGTIYIRSDGSIDPPTANITTSDYVTYTFNGSIEDSIVIERNNIVVDGAGYTVQGIGVYSAAIFLSGRSNVTIKNMEIKTFYYGVFLDSLSNYNTVSGNNITNNSIGIYLYSSSNNIVSANNIKANIYGGVRLEHSFYNNVSENNITNNGWYGVYFEFSSNNTVSGNNIKTHSDYGVCLYDSSNNTVLGNIFANDGLYIYGSYGSVVVNNLVNGEPLVYLEGVSDMVVRDAGQVILVNCDGIVVDNFNLSNASVGVELWQTSNTKITNNNITYNNCGIILDYSSSSTVSGNNITNNSMYSVIFAYSSNNSVCENNITNNYFGVCLGFSSNNSVCGNNITNNSGYSVILGSSSNYNTVSGNNITNNNIGVYLDSSCNNTISGNNIKYNTQDGVYFGYSSNYNTVSENNITNNDDGICLSGSSNNTVSGNNIKYNTWDGVFLSSSSNNRFFHNNFNGNRQQVDIYVASTNVWDDGYPSGGNYWSDYGGTDADDDGIGDSPYVIDADNQDNFPLMCPLPYIAGDCNHNGIVNIIDATLIGWYWQQTVPPAPKNADVNGDGTINAADAQTIIDNWLKHA
jgi:parallel beta-helix repeat protein